MVQRTSLQEDCPADHPGLQGASCSPRAPGRAFSAPRKHDAVAAQLLVSIVQGDMHVWHMLALHIPCHACTHIHGRGDQDAFCALLLCVGSSSFAPTRKGGVCVWRLRPQLSLLLRQLGVEPCAPCALPIITITFVLVLFCFVIFSLFCFSRGHNWDIIPASRHKRSLALQAEVQTSQSIGNVSINPVYQAGLSNKL